MCNLLCFLSSNNSVSLLLYCVKSIMNIPPFLFDGAIITILFMGIMVRVVRQWPGRPGFNRRSSNTKDSKMVLDTTLLNTQYYKVKIKGKVEQSREKISALPYTSV